MNFEVIIFYLLLIDSLGANLVIWCKRDWYIKHLRLFSRWFPAGRGWAIYYLVLVLWIGFLLYRQGLF